MNIPDEIQQIVNGYQSTVVTIGHIADTVFYYGPQGAANYYLKRHAKDSGHDSEKEYKVHRWLEGKLPVASVKAFEKDDKYFYLLLCEMPDNTFDKCAWENDLPGLAKVLADCLQQIHSTPINDCGFDESISSKLSRAQRNVEQNTLRPDIYHYCSSRDARSDLNYLIKHKPENESRVLTHGDFKLDNLLYKDGSVSAILDLGEVGVCDPYQDFSTLCQSLVNWTKSSEQAKEILILVLQNYGISDPDWDRLRYFTKLNELL